MAKRLGKLISVMSTKGGVGKSYKVYHEFDILLKSIIYLR